MRSEEGETQDNTATGCDAVLEIYEREFGASAGRLEWIAVLKIGRRGGEGGSERPGGHRRGGCRPTFPPFLPFSLAAADACAWPLPSVAEPLCPSQLREHASFHATEAHHNQRVVNRPHRQQHKHIRNVAISPYSSESSSPVRHRSADRACSKTTEISYHLRFRVSQGLSPMSSRISPFTRE